MYQTINSMFNIFSLSLLMHLAYIHIYENPLKQTNHYLKKKSYLPITTFKLYSIKYTVVTK